MSRVVSIDRDKFNKAIDASKQDLVTYVMSGRCVSFEDYKNKVGELRGLNIATDHFKDTIQSGEDDE